MYRYFLVDRMCPWLLEERSYPISKNKTVTRKTRSIKNTSLLSLKEAIENAAFVNDTWYDTLEGAKKAKTVVCSRASSSYYKAASAEFVRILRIDLINGVITDVTPS